MPKYRHAFRTAEGETIIYTTGRVVALAERLYRISAKVKAQEPQFHCTRIQNAHLIDMEGVEKELALSG